MDIRVFDRKEDVAPLLVELYDTHELYTLAQNKDKHARKELTRVISDLFRTELSFSEKEIISDILIELIRQAEIDLRRALAQKISTLENVPLRVVLQLANDEIDVAKSIIEHSPVLGDLDLAYIIKSKGREYWHVVAKRKKISAQIVRFLTETGDVDTALNLLANKNISLHKNALLALADLAKHEEGLAKPLLQRDEIDHEIATQLYDFVSQELKSYIIKNFTIESRNILEKLDETLDELSSIKTHDFYPTDAMISEAEHARKQGVLKMHMMISILRRKQIASFIAHFSKFTGEHVETIIDILGQKDSIGLSVLCKKHDILKPDFISIYVLTNAMRSNNRVMDAGELEKIARSY